MKILFFSQVGQTLFGANRSLLDIVVGLSNLGHDVRVFCSSDGELAQQLKAANIPIFVSNYSGSAISAKNRFFLFDYIVSFFSVTPVSTILDKIWTWKPDVVHSNSTTIDIWFRFAQYYHIPHVWHVREFWWKDYSLVYTPSKKQFYQNLNKSNLIIFISQSLFDEYKSIVTTNYVILLNPISSFPQKKKLISAPHCFSFLVPWYMNKNKGQMIALRAFRKLSKKFKNSKICFLGNGPRSYIFKLKFYKFLFFIKNVYFLWYKNNPEEFFRQSDAVIVCSKNEALGRVTLEAMMYWVPVIWRNTAWTAELIWNNRWIPFDWSPEDLFQKMKLLIGDANLRQRCLDRGTDYINSYFLKWPYINKIESLFLNLK